MLKAWAQEKELIRADHFFWITGAPMQKSREGLLRHILHSVLQALPSNSTGAHLDLAKRVCASRWSSNNVYRPWTCDELYDTLSRLTLHKDAKFFFLIDGLDECEPQDRHTELANEILKLSQLPNVKLCVSSRPWNSFLTRFSHAQTLHLEDLTYSDMELYIKNRLADAEADNEICAEISRGSSETGYFIADIARTAEGVFLWTELVVKALSVELRKGRDLGQLKQTLLAFPAGLDEYFHQLILGRITKTGQNTIDTAAVIKLAIEVAKGDTPERKILPEPHSFLNFWLLMNGFLQHGFSWTDHKDIWYTPEDAKKMMKQTKGFLEETCKDLLVMTRKGLVFSSLGHSDLRWDVEFLHRTVSDFFYDVHLKETIEQRSPDHFGEQGFLDDLRKLRYMCLAREEAISCCIAERDFSCNLEESESLDYPDKIFVYACEALMVRRLQQGCNCAGDAHYQWSSPDLPYRCATSGLSNYSLAVVTLWPYLAIQRYPRGKLLVNVLSGCLKHVIKRSGIRKIDKIGQYCSRATKGTRGLCSLTKDGKISPHGFLFASLQVSSAYALDTSENRLLVYLLRSGADPNHHIMGRIRSHRGKAARHLPHPVKHTIWETWLSEAYLALRKMDQHTVPREQLDKFHAHIQATKNMISDTVTTLLLHGADPDCVPCISDHEIGHDTGKPCQALILENILNVIVPCEKVQQIQTLRIRRSEEFDPHTARRIQRLRAIKSWMVSRWRAQSQLAYLDDPHAIFNFLAGFIGYDDMICNSHIKCSDFKCADIALASCLDCSGHYHLCLKSADLQFSDIPDDTTMIGHIVHDHILSITSHTSIVFSRSTDGRHKFLGLESSISVLEDWYANNMAEANSALD